MGSSSYITNLDGEINQHMEYLPFGELLVEEHLSSYNSPFKFNAKEFDAETGNYYYGARYYNPRWSIWMSVDPLAENYPAWSPYNYVLNNPVKLTDSTGMCPDDDPDCTVNKENPIQLDEVVVMGTNNSANKPSSMSFSGDMPDHMKYGEQPPTWNSPYAPGELDQYNKDQGTNYTEGNQYNQWYYDNHYKPEFDEMVSDIHTATGEAAELMMYIMPTPLAGGMLLSKAPNLYRSAKAANAFTRDASIYAHIAGNVRFNQYKRMGMEYLSQPFSRQNIGFSGQRALMNTGAGRYFRGAYKYNHDVMNPTTLNQVMQIKDLGNYGLRFFR